MGARTPPPSLGPGADPGGARLAEVVGVRVSGHPTVHPTPDPDIPEGVAGCGGRTSPLTSSARRASVSWFKRGSSHPLHQVLPYRSGRQGQPFTSDPRNFGDSFRHHWCRWRAVRVAAQGLRSPSTSDPILTRTRLAGWALPCKDCDPVPATRTQESRGPPLRLTLDRPHPTFH